MIFDNSFYEDLSKLDSFKGTTEWNDFFETIDTLEEIAEKINDKLNDGNSNTKRLDNKAVTLTKKLDGMKNEISKLTNIDAEYDAVYRCVSYLEEYFNVTE
jgi:prophage DNA circulation protein